MTYNFLPYQNVLYYVVPGPNITAVHWTAAILRLGTTVNGLKFVGNMLTMSGMKCSETKVWSSSVQEPFHPSATAGKTLVYNYLSCKSWKYQHDHISGKKTVVAWGSHSIGLWGISRCVYLKMNWWKIQKLKNRCIVPYKWDIFTFEWGDSPCRSVPYWWGNTILVCSIDNSSHMFSYFSL